ncbi:MAG: hypothetical protein LUE86_09570 [Clostridiales bacterium]|nr:hypothetical protein [Clostridiales bacterium]
MDQLHTELEPWDWEQPETVVEKTEEETGITDLVSITAELRAEQSLHDKEQQRLETSLTDSVEAFETKIIETVEDTYWVQNQYRDILSGLNQMDEGTLRADLLERTVTKYETFSRIITEMHDTIVLYEAQKAKEQAAAQKKAEEDAVSQRENLEIQTRKNTFLSALQDVEALEYQSPDADALVDDAIDKLSLVEEYEEAQSYITRLNEAIERISTLPTTPYL